MMLVRPVALTSAACIAAASLHSTGLFPAVRTAASRASPIVIVPSDAGGFAATFFSFTSSPFAYRFEFSASLEKKQSLPFTPPIPTCFAHRLAGVSQREGGRRMDSRPSGPAMLTAEEQAVLNEGIGLILSRWTAMRAAVDNGWGGRDSHQKAERTVSNVLHYFIHLKDPTMGFDGLADILENGLHELNTVADDGSLEEVTETLLDLYYECLEGNYQRVETLRVTSSQTSARVVKVSNGNDEDDEESDDENEEDTDMMVDASEQSSNRLPEAMPVDEPKADDGWTVVPSRKNKGKRN